MSGRMAWVHKAEDPRETHGYHSPYLLEILSTQHGAPAFATATGSLVANTGQVVSNSGLASGGYCLGSDGLLHWLPGGSVRVEPAGLLVEGASINYSRGSVSIGDATWSTASSGGAAAPTITLNSTDVLDPAGGHEASKIVIPACSTSQTSEFFQTGGGGAGKPGYRSMYMRLPTGSPPTLVEFSNNSHNTTVTVTDQWQRFSQLDNVSLGQNWFGWSGTGLGASTAGFTVYCWGMQTEPSTTAPKSPGPTSPIRTTSAAVTRDADVISVANPLAALSQPVNNWRVGVNVSPLDGSWTPNAYLSRVEVIQAGSNFSPSTWDMSFGDSDFLTTRLWTSGGVQTYGLWAYGAGGLTGAHTVEWQVPAGNLVLQVDGVSKTLGSTSGLPTVINPQPATLTLGAASSLAAGFLHLKDIYVNNT